MELYRASLGRDELEPLQQARRQPRMPPHRGPLRTVEDAALAQQGRVDGDLAEVVQPSGPAQAVDVRKREPERTREAVNVAGDPQRVPVRGRIALVDDVGERLECAQRLPLQASEPKLGLVEGDREGDKDDDVPRMSDRQQRGR